MSKTAPEAHADLHTEYRTRIKQSIIRTYFVIEGTLPFRELEKTK